MCTENQNFKLLVLSNSILPCTPLVAKWISTGWLQYVKSSYSGQSTCVCPSVKPDITCQPLPTIQVKLLKYIIIMMLNGSRYIPCTYNITHFLDTIMYLYLITNRFLL